MLAAGGGLAAETPAFERLLDACYTVWLKASPQEHWDRVIEQGDLAVRDGIRDSEALRDMRRIIAQRESLYRLADAQLETSGKRVRSDAGRVDRKSSRGVRVFEWASVRLRLREAGTCIIVQFQALSVRRAHDRL